MPTDRYLDECHQINIRKNVAWPFDIEKAHEGRTKFEMEWGREKNHSADENDENEHVTRTPLAERICAIGLPYTVVALMFYVDDHVQRIFAKLYIDCVYDFRLCFSQENKKQKFRAREQIYYMCLHTSGTVEHWPVSIARHQTHRGTHTQVSFEINGRHVWRSPSLLRCPFDTTVQLYRRVVFDYMLHNKYHYQLSFNSISGTKCQLISHIMKTLTKVWQQQQPQKSYAFRCYRAIVLHTFIDIKWKKGVNLIHIRTRPISRFSLYGSSKVPNTSFIVGARRTQKATIATTLRESNIT